MHSRLHDVSRHALPCDMIIRQPDIPVAISVLSPHFTEFLALHFILPDHVAVRFLPPVMQLLFERMRIYYAYSKISTLSLIARCPLMGVALHEGAHFVTHIPCYFAQQSTWHIYSGCLFKFNFLGALMPFIYVRY